MGWVKNMGLKRSFLLIIMTYLIGAILLSVVFYQACEAVIDYFNLYYVLDTESALEILPEGENLERREKDYIMGRIDSGERYICKREPGYSIMTFLQFAGPVVLIAAALILADAAFYRMKLKHPIDVLRNGAERIQRQDLDFQVENCGSDELGQLCAAFEIMRQTLLENNRELWRQAEERKRLNAAFSHDLRNPVAVLKGAAKLLQKSAEQERLNEECVKESVGLINQYAGRIESYVEAMTGAQKLEAMECRPQSCTPEEIQSELQGGIAILAQAAGKQAKLTYSGTAAQIHLDKQFVFNTAENLVQNALRYARQAVTVEARFETDRMVLCVMDDGPGFPETILKKGVTPFLHGEAAGSEHFGMGLYICKLMCEKHGGSLTIENREHGARVTAIFDYSS